jgi:hypothetical protein
MTGQRAAKPRTGPARRHLVALETPADPVRVAALLAQLRADHPRLATAAPLERAVQTVPVSAVYL